MAKSGRVSRAGAAKTDAASATRRALVDAAVESLRFDGFAGASARAIAARAGVNPGLIFYHFGSVADLLLAGGPGSKPGCQRGSRKSAGVAWSATRLQSTGQRHRRSCLRSRPKSSAKTLTRVT